MIFKNSQQDFNIELDDSIKNVSLKISGGADSAIVGYMLSKYVSEHRPDIKIYPITVIHPNKPWQEIYSKRVLDFLKKEFGDIFGKHYVASATEASDYITSQERLWKKAHEENSFNAAFAGITANPPSDVQKHFRDFKNKVANGPTDQRDRTATKKPQYNKRSYVPLINVDKKGVAEFYDTLGVRDTLYPITRSCEAYDVWPVYDINKHCDGCWFCKERFWGFGSYT